MEDQDRPESDFEWLVERPPAASSEQVRKIVTTVRRRVGLQDVLSFTLLRLWLPLFHVIGRLISDVQRRPPGKEGSREHPHR